MAAPEGTLAAERGALEAGERGGVDVVLVRDAAVHGLTRHLLVPRALRAGHRDTGSCLKGGGGHSEERQMEPPRRGETPFSPRLRRRVLPGAQRSMFSVSSSLSRIPTTV